MIKLISVGNFTSQGFSMDFEGLENGNHKWFSWKYVASKILDKDVQAKKFEGIKWQVPCDGDGNSIPSAILSERDNLRAALKKLKSEAWDTPVKQLMYNGNPVVREINDLFNDTDAQQVEGKDGK